jgi:hypothetical protein
MICLLRRFIAGSIPVLSTFLMWRNHACLSFAIVASMSWSFNCYSQLSAQFDGTPQELYCVGMPGNVTVGFRSNGPGLTDDMLVAWRSNNSSLLTISSGFSDGAYTSVQSLIPGSFVSTSMDPVFAFGDLDLDGDEDAVVYWNSWQPYAPDQLFVLWWNAGSATLEVVGQPIVMNVLDDGFFSGLNLFDVNDDGLLDIVLGGTWRWMMNPIIHGDFNEILVQTVDNQFVPYTPSLPKDHYAHHHDMDGDGKGDLLYRDSAPELKQYRNLGGDQFVLEATYAGLSSPGSDSWHDVDSDGIPDLVYDRFSSADTTRLRAALLTGGLLQTPGYLFDIPMASNVGYARDLNNDALMDLVLQVGSGMNNVQLIIGAGDGSWSSQPPLSLLADLGPGWHVLPPSDVDGDGDLDLLVHNNDCVSWLENHLGEVSVNELEIVPSILAYPNPSTERLEIQATSVHGTIEIHDSSGRTVYQSQFNERAQIDLTVFSSGFYHCLVRDFVGRELRVRFVKG